MNAYQRFVRPLLFHCDPERIHEQTLALAEQVGSSALGRHLLASLFAYADARLATQVGGLHFANPLGMAAGFDKNGRVIQALAAMGFGFVEVGSVSAHPSAGNPRPRLFRLPLDEAIVVNYGVPNDGAAVVADRVSQRPIAVPLGINLVETNTGQAIEPDAVVAELVAALEPFVGQSLLHRFQPQLSEHDRRRQSHSPAGSTCATYCGNARPSTTCPPSFSSSRRTPIRRGWTGCWKRSIRLLSSRASFSTCRRGTNYPLRSPSPSLRLPARNLMRPARSGPNRRNRALLVRAHRPPAARDNRRGRNFIGPRRISQNPPRGFAGAAILSTNFQGSKRRATNQRRVGAPVGARWVRPGGRRSRHRQPSKSSGVAIPTECGD